MLNGSLDYFPLFCILYYRCLQPIPALPKNSSLPMSVVMIRDQCLLSFLSPQSEHLGTSNHWAYAGEIFACGSLVQDHQRMLTPTSHHQVMIPDYLVQALKTQ